MKSTSSLQLVARGIIPIRPSEITNPESKQISQSINSNIYFLCTRPKIDIKYIHKKTIQKESVLELKIASNSMSKIIGLFSKENYTLINGQMKNSRGLLINAFEVILPVIKQLQQKGHYDEAMLLLPFTDMKIEYIGQAFGESKKRTSIDRLMCHEHLQCLQSRILDNREDLDIWLMLLEIAPQQQFRILGEDATDEDVSDLIDMGFSSDEGYLPDDIMINFLEGALINFFKPNLNINFKENFLDPNHISYYDVCKNVKVRQFGFEINTFSSIPIRFYTNSEDVKIFYHKAYTFKNQADIQNFFKILDEARS